MAFFESKKAFRDTILLSLGRGLSVFGQIAYVRVITELVDPAQLGVFYYVLAIGGIFSFAFFSPISIYITRSFLVWYKDKISRVNLIAILRLLFYVGLTCCFVFFIYWHDFRDNDQIRLIYFTFIPVIFFTSSLISIGTGLFNLLQKRGLFVAFTSILIWSNLLFIYLLATLAGRRAEIMLLGQMISQVIVAIVVLFVLYKLIKANQEISRHPRINWAEAWGFCWPVAVTQILFWAQSEGYRIPLRENAGAYGLGIFSITFGITIALFAFFQSVFAQLYDPIFWKSVSYNGYTSSDLSNYLKNHWPYLILFTFWVIGVSSPILKVVASATYSRYSYLVILISITELIRHTGLGLYNSVYASNRNRILILAALLSSISCLGGTYYLGRIIDPIIATIVSLAVAYLIAVFILGVFLKKGDDFIVPWKECGIAALVGIVLVSILLLAEELGLASSIAGSLIALAVGGALFVLAAYCLSVILRKPDLGVPSWIINRS